MFRNSTCILIYIMVVTKVQGFEGRGFHGRGVGVCESGGNFDKAFKAAEK